MNITRKSEVGFEKIVIFEGGKINKFHCGFKTTGNQPQDPYIPKTGFSSTFE
jgi:hypothetical protein